ncbi:MAG TPA: hypothetical protein GX015_05120 [Corynebacterium sp.]|uniref:hypothetical protein n=1 Tax=Corynebacterium sp. TaxID=1720 RepID=UPI00181FA8DA|nr:hypothetical protein [Corynebacterium sp.]HHT31912.1 hypothetical protein [Corynebacterium sp.]
MEGVLILVAFFSVVALWMWLRDKLWAGATRAVFSGSHKKGQTATHSTAHFRAPVDKQQFLSALVSYLNLPTEAPAVIAGLHVHKVDLDEGLVVFVTGNKWSEAMRLGVVAWPEGEGWEAGCKGEATVLNWTEADGLVTATKEMERIFHGIDATVQHFQGSVEYTHDPG